MCLSLHPILCPYQLLLLLFLKFGLTMQNTRGWAGIIFNLIDGIEIIIIIKKVKHKVRKPKVRADFLNMEHKA